MMRLQAWVLAGATLSLCGCGLGTSTEVGGPLAVTAATTPVSGSVHGGQQPVSGATVQLWQVGTLGYGSAPTALGTSTTTAADGSFSLTGNYSCTNGANGSSTLVYVTATGGNPGLSAGTNNDALAMMTALGACGTLSSTTTIAINEVTTVASVYALSQFMNASGGVGTYKNLYTGLTTAFATVNNLVSTSTGVARSSAGSGTASVFPTATLNTLGNILTPCINTTSSSSNACQLLFSAAKPSGGTAPVNTLAAALDIALNPGQNQTALFSLSSANVAFQPTLSAVPNDWTLSVGYALGRAPTSIALDFSGNLWTASYGTGISNSSVTFMSPSGTAASNSPFANVYTYGAWGIAIDTANDAWVSGKDFGNMSQFDINSGAVESAGYYSTLSLNKPEGVAVDANRTIWIANNGNNTVTGFNSSQVATQYTTGGFNAPQSIAVDSNGNPWVTNNGGGSVTKITAGTTTGTPYTGGGLSNPAGIAVDGANGVWVTDSATGVVSALNSSGTAVSGGSGYTGGGLTNSNATQMDGAGHLWVADMSGNRLTELNGSGAALSPATGFVGPTALGAPIALAIDASGNVWVGNNAPVGGATITEFVGLASPAVMPLVSAVSNGQIGKRPGTLTITTRTLTSGTNGTPYSKNFAATGANGTYTWAVTSGLAALQTAGFSVSTTGFLSGFPSSAGSYAFTLQVTDTPTGATASANFTLTIN